MVNVGWVGNFRRAGKNYGTYLRLCKQNNWTQFVAGGVDSGVFVEHEDMPGFYDACDVLLVTSVWENHPLIVYEALSCGVPVVMGKYVGDCFRNNIEGVVYFDDVGNDEYITKAVNLALQYKDELSKAGVECMRREWMWEHVKPQYTQMFKSLSTKNSPRVVFLTNEYDWSWGWMAKEIKKHAYKKMSVVSLSDPIEEITKQFKKADIILNHPWHLTKDLEIPPEKHVLCVNGPAFLNPAYSEAWVKALESCKAITSASLNVLDLLRFTEKPLFYATRGVDVTLFKPSFVRENKEYLSKQDEDTLKRLSELGVCVH